MYQKILRFVFLLFFVHLSVVAGNTVGNRLHETNNKIFNTRHLAGFEHDKLSEMIKKYDVFHIKSDKIISYLQNEQNESNLLIDLFHLGTWHLNLYNNFTNSSSSILSYHGITCSSLGEIHFKIEKNFIEAYIDNGENSYFIEPLQHFTNDDKQQDLYVIYELQNIYDTNKTKRIQCFLQAARNLEQQKNLGNGCNFSLSYEKSKYCLNEKNISPILGNTENGGLFSAFPTGLHINEKTGEIVVEKSKPNIYIVSYKKGNCMVDFVLDILDLPNASFKLPHTYFQYSDAPIILTKNATTGFFSGLGIKDDIFYPNLVPKKSLKQKAIEITFTATNQYCENSETQNVVLHNRF